MCLLCEQAPLHDMPVPCVATGCDLTCVKESWGMEPHKTCACRANSPLCV